MNERVEPYEKKEESSVSHGDSSHSYENKIYILGENPPSKDIDPQLSIGRKRPYPRFTFEPLRRPTRSIVEVERADN